MSVHKTLVSYKHFYDHEQEAVGERAVDGKDKGQNRMPPG